MSETREKFAIPQRARAACELQLQTERPSYLTEILPPNAALSVLPDNTKLDSDTDDLT